MVLLKVFVTAALKVDYLVDNWVDMKAVKTAVSMVA